MVCCVLVWAAPLLLAYCSTTTDNSVYCQHRLLHQYRPCWQFKYEVELSMCLQVLLSCKTPMSRGLFFLCTVYGEFTIQRSTCSNIWLLALASCAEELLAIRVEEALPSQPTCLPPLLRALFQTPLFVVKCCSIAAASSVVSVTFSASFYSLVWSGRH